jgi:L-malate glycosyltransferase
VALRVFVLPPSAMLTDHRPHGDGLVALGFIRELAARGHELHVAAGRVDLRGDLPPNVHVHPLGSGEPTKAARLRFMRRVRHLYRRLASSTNFDVIHQLTPVDVGVSLALADVTVPVVLGPYVPDWAPSGQGADAVHGPASLRVKRGLRWAQQWRATTVLLSTPAAASKLELRSQRPHVRELPLGIEERTWLPSQSEGSGQDVLFLANLEVRKGIHVALDAFDRIAAELDGARLIIAGAGSELDEVRRRIDVSPASNQVELLGHLDRHRAIATMQACDVYCLPSYGEPYGLSVLEAMACARPVVATDAGGPRYLVSDRGGRKVPPGDAAGLAAALREVLVDPQLRRAMGEHNRRVVEQRYAWSRVVVALESLYEEAVREPRGGRRTLRGRAPA